MTRVLAWLRRNWLVLAGLAVVVGSDYKFRTRDTTAAVGGSVDAFILLELGLYALVALYVLATWVRPGRVVRQPEILLIGFYVLIIALSLTRTPYPSFGAARTVEMLVLAALTLTVAVRAERADLHRLAHGYVVLIVLSIGVGIAVPSTPVSNLQVGRFTWLAIHPTSAGLLLSIAVVIAFSYAALRADRPGPVWNRWVYVGLTAATTGALVATQTRAAVLGAVAGALAALFAHHRGRRRLELMAGAALGLGLLALTAVPTIEEYLARGESVEKLSTLNSRTDLWSVAWEAVLEQPVYGYGVGASQGIFQEAVGLGGGHNALINVLVDLGFVGAIGWVALVSALGFGLLTAARTTKDGEAVTDRSMLLGLLVVLLVNGMFTSGPGGVANVAATWLFLSAGWSVCLRREAAGAAPVVSGTGPAGAQAIPRAPV